LKQLIGGAAALAAILPAAAGAQDAYPNRPVRMIVPFAPGGTTDVMARVVGAHLTQALGQQVIVDNRPGANGIIASEMTAKASPDGHTLMYVAIGHAINSLIYKKLPYDTLKDFTAISLGAVFTQLLLVHPGIPATSVKELIALARAKKIANYASGGIGSSQHLAGALFTYLAKVELTHVPYKGGAPALTDLMARNVDMMIIQPQSAEQVKSGRVRALAVSSPKRSAIWPDLPTVAEAGLPGFESQAWYGMVAPAKLPRAVLTRISEESIRALTTDEQRKRIANLGGEVVASTPAEFDAFIRAEIARYGKVTKAAGISAD
jgi:tripartite-type tricarboxylate transporter receptor subunit TctC